MNKTPDEIKRNIITCMELNMEKFMPGATQKSLADALACIQQLEAERDAAIRDMTNMAKEYGEPMCEYCGADSDAECRPCYTHNEGFRWRGVQKE